MPRSTTNQFRAPSPAPGGSALSAEDLGQLSRILAQLNVNRGDDRGNVTSFPFGAQSASGNHPQAKEMYDSPQYRAAEVVRRTLEATLKAVDHLNAATPETPHRTMSATDVRRAIKERRNRDKFFSEHLFADPAWDMLLQLYVAELDQIRLATSSLCASAAVPTTTALRWISTLANEGLIDRRNDPLDGRRVFIALSAKGVRSMEAYFQTSASNHNCEG